MLDIMTGNREAPEIVRDIFRAAIEQRATDIYFLPQKERLQVRWRVGGAQEDIVEMPRLIGDQCLTHVKVLGGLLTYRTNIAQDGVIRWPDPPTEMRTASMPTIYGERITIRIMSNAVAPDYIEDLGFDAPSVETLQRVIARPHGLIILTGPTGCGKTTTIYALIRELIREQQDPASIITLEDPVERVIDGVSQVAVNGEGEEWNYDIALKAALRQDVKTLVVGEMRDRAVAKFVLDAALTGHRVITTYHAGDIPGVYARLLHQEFEPFLIAAAINGVVTQRLVQRPDAHPVPVVGLLEPDDSWREFICGNPDLGKIREEVRKRPGADIRRQAIALAEAGRISQEHAALIGAG